MDSLRVADSSALDWSTIPLYTQRQFDSLVLAYQDSVTHAPVEFSISWSDVALGFVLAGCLSLLALYFIGRHEVKKRNDIVIAEPMDQEWK